MAKLKQQLSEADIAIFTYRKAVKAQLKECGLNQLKLQLEYIKSSDCKIAFSILKEDAVQVLTNEIEALECKIKARLKKR